MHLARKPKLSKKALLLKLLASQPPMPSWGQMSKEILDEIEQKIKAMDHEHDCKMYKHSDHFCKIWVGTYIFNVCCVWNGIAHGILHGHMYNIVLAVFNIIAACFCMAQYIKTDEERTERFIKLL